MIYNRKQGEGGVVNNKPCSESTRCNPRGDFYKCSKPSSEGSTWAIITRSVYHNLQSQMIVSFIQLQVEVWQASLSGKTKYIDNGY